MDRVCERLLQDRFLSGLWKNDRDELESLVVILDLVGQLASVAIRTRSRSDLASLVMRTRFMSFSKSNGILFSSTNLQNLQSVNYFKKNAYSLMSTAFLRIGVTMSRLCFVLNRFRSDFSIRLP